MNKYWISLCLVIFISFTVSDIEKGMAFTIYVQQGEPDLVESVKYTEEEMQCIMSWSSFLEDCNNPTSYVSSVGDIDDLTLQMELNFDQKTFTGTLSGSKIVEGVGLKTQHSFQGDISGEINQENWRSTEWHWEFEGEAALSLSYHLERLCVSEEAGSFWETREETIQVTAIVTGSTFGGEEGFGNLNIQWRDTGGYNQGIRRFFLSELSGETGLEAEIPNPIDLNASLILPDSVNLATQSASFRFEPEGRDIDMIDTVVWHFYHWDSEQDKYRWFTSFETQGTENLNVDATARGEWKELTETFGENLDQGKILWMKLEAWFYASEGRDLIKPLSSEFSYETTTSPASSDPQVNVPSSSDPGSGGLPVSIPEIPSVLPSGTTGTLIQGVAAAGAGLGAAAVIGRLFGGLSQPSSSGKNLSDLIASSQKLNDVPENPEWHQETQLGQKEIIRTGKKSDVFRTSRERRRINYRIDGEAEQDRVSRGLTHEQEYDEIMDERPVFMERYDRNIGGKIIKISGLGRQFEEITAEERTLYQTWQVKMKSYLRRRYHRMMGPLMGSPRQMADVTAVRQ
jgi:hypothetical protein